MLKKKKYLPFFGLGVLFAGLIAGLVLVRTIQLFRQKAATPVPNYTISPAAQNVAPGGNFTFTVRMDTGTYKIGGVNIYVNYDPSALQVISVQKGSGISTLDQEIVNQIDNTVGEVHSAYFTLNPSANGVIGPDLETLTVSAIVKADVTSGSFDLTFGAGSEMGDAANGNNVLAGTAPGTVNVALSVTPTPGGGGVETVFDNFETYTGTTNLRTFYRQDTASNTALVSLNNANKIEGNYSMAFNYTVGTPNYAGVIRNLGTVNWSQYSGLRLWLKPDNTSRMFTIGLKEAGGEYFEAAQVMNTNVGSYMNFMFNNFTVLRNPSNGVLDLNNISEISIYVYLPEGATGGTATIYMDDIKLITGTGTATPTPTTPANTPTPTATRTPTPTLNPAFTPTPVILQPADTTLSISPSTSTRTIDEQFNISVNINTGINEVVGVELYMSFNPSIITVVDIVPGGFLLNPVTTVKQVNNTTGKISYVLHIPPSQAAQKGTGSLAVITFRALNTGTANITFDTTSIVGAINTGARNALKSTLGGSVTVIRPSIPGDINDMGTFCGDGKVDILDYVILFENFGEAPTDHRCADINRDGRVNILDYVILFENFGKVL